MKKTLRRKIWISSIILFLVIIFCAFLVMMPSTIQISRSIPVKTSTDAAYRYLITQENWNKLSNGDIKITQRLMNAINIEVLQNNFTASVKLLLVPMTRDSLLILWQCVLPSITNPFSKMQQVSQAKILTKKIDHILNDFKQIVEKDENIYGLSIIEKSTVDTLLISTKFQTTRYPSTEEIYYNIDKLVHEAKKWSAQQTGFPMLNVTKADNSSFHCMVAIPINKKIDPDPPVFFVRMIPGRFLTTQVVGGPNTIRHGYDMMSLYYSDFNRTSMAIPFEYLVTDRRHEPDTSKWITKIYGPVY